MGVTSYETFVADGHTDYFGANNYKTTAPAKYAALDIADTCAAEQFKADLKAHQQGQSDYLTFIGQCAKLGVEKWAVCLDKMTCTYYDKSGNVILVEKIPQ